MTLPDPARASELWKAADYLEFDVPKLLNGAKFDLGIYGEFEFNDDHVDSPESAARCGFEGCALGWLWWRYPELHKHQADTTAINLNDDVLELFGIPFIAAATMFGTEDIDFDEDAELGDPRFDLGCGIDIDPHDPSAAAHRIRKYLRHYNVPIPAGYTLRTQ